MNFLLEIGLMATLGFGTDPQRLQDVQTPYFLIEKKATETLTAKILMQNRIYGGRTTENLFVMGLETKKSGFNYGAGFQAEFADYNRTSKTGEVVYIKIFYRFEE